jgi:endoglucanase
MGAQSFPVRLNIANRLVYSPHDYPKTIFAQPWFSDPNYPNNLPAVWDSYWGYLHKNNVAPVLLGEFGTKLTDPSDVQWLDTLVNYLGKTATVGAKGINWTFWSWNPNSGDTGGILNDDWTTVNTAKHNKLVTLQFALDGPGTVPTATPSSATVTPRPATATPIGATATPRPATATPAPATATPQASGACTIAYLVRDQWADGFTVDITITNNSMTFSSWTLAWVFSGNQKITNMWNATPTQSGQNVSAANLSYNGSIAKGANTVVGFQGSYTGTNAKPTSFKLNGTTCAIAP